jgi:acetyl/propionyl-CoA carboxylase alpha subunit
MSEIFRSQGIRNDLPRARKLWRFTSLPGGWVLAERELPDGSRERRRIFLSQERNSLSFSLGGKLWFGELIESAVGGSADSGSEADLTAQFPGKVRKILVASGQTVAAGDPLMLVEAMKMEFAVKAPFAGTVSQVRVQEGQQLSPGDKLVDIKPGLEPGAAHG